MCLFSLSRAWKSSLWVLNYMLGNLIPAMTKEFPNVSPFIMKFASLFSGIWQQIFPSGSKISPFTPEDLLSDGDSLNWKWAWFGIKWGDIKKSNTMNTFSGPKSESRPAAQSPRTPPALRGNLIYKWWSTNAVPHVNPPPFPSQTHIT